MDLVTSPREPAERVEYVRELVGKRGLADLSRASLLAKDPWHKGFGVTTVCCAVSRPR